MQNRQSSAAFESLLEIMELVLFGHITLSFI